ncbi:monovalent cation/H(+) antiporter subunit G [Candidatus Neoehrlichia procyonis]|uniref:Monovalent cation/proton antiporter, MnhG/PhaG subunit n=1 Tax=Candidatus Neoehrlichia procyonis str. RAC413 TaxID=1359163 RepID=A0A0F3NMK6_9RICK|nr:monovalent cation/H(+) antiporter subunit G [Candidatus Neoehrlichia lotoris]KJV69011.1 monovalent cation/proton antiporter, MnhG/PhaG subunit [Candidatus Neoehrlichia lotoris str. RAC413]
MMTYFSLLVIGLGLFLMVTAAIGVVRFPNFYTKVHAAGIADTLGSALVLSGLDMQYTFSLFTIKVILLICILWITNATACHMLTHCAYKSDKEL